MGLLKLKYFKYYLVISCRNVSFELQKKLNARKPFLFVDNLTLMKTD